MRSRDARPVSGAGGDRVAARPGAGARRHRLAADREPVHRARRACSRHPSSRSTVRSAIAMADGPAAALPLVDALAGDLDGYHLFHAARADLLRRLDRPDEAARSVPARAGAGHEPAGARVPRAAAFGADGLIGSRRRSGTSGRVRESTAVRPACVLMKRNQNGLSSVLEPWSGRRLPPVVREEGALPMQRRSMIRRAMAIAVAASTMLTVMGPATARTGGDRNPEAVRAGLRGHAPAS